jgi:hypothetical protein
MAICPGCGKEETSDHLFLCQGEQVSAVFEDLSYSSILYWKCNLMLCINMTNGFTLTNLPRHQSYL